MRLLDGRQLDPKRDSSTKLPRDEMSLLPTAFLGSNGKRNRIMFPKASSPSPRQVPALCVTLVMLLAGWSHSAANRSSSNPSHFEKDIRPILQEKCIACHGEGIRQNGLDLRTRDSLLAGN